MCTVWKSFFCFDASLHHPPSRSGGRALCTVGVRAWDELRGVRRDARRSRAAQAPGEALVRTRRQVRLVGARFEAVVRSGTSPAAEARRHGRSRAPACSPGAPSLHLPHVAANRLAEPQGGSARVRRRALTRCGHAAPAAAAGHCACDQHAAREAGGGGQAPPARRRPRRARPQRHPAAQTHLGTPSAPWRSGGLGEHRRARGEDGRARAVHGGVPHAGCPRRRPRRHAARAADRHRLSSRRAELRPRRLPRRRIHRMPPQCTWRPELPGGAAGRPASIHAACHARTAFLAPRAPRRHPP
jgi:hypothetical protein